CDLALCSADMRTPRRQFGADDRLVGGAETVTDLTDLDRRTERRRRQKDEVRGRAYRYTSPGGLIHHCHGHRAALCEESSNTTTSAADSRAGGECASSMVTVGVDIGGFILSSDNLAITVSWSALRGPWRAALGSEDC